MAKIQRVPLTMGHLVTRLSYLVSCLREETDVIKKLHLVQAKIDCIRAIKDLQKSRK